MAKAHSPEKLASNTFLLTMAMTALGLSTVASQFKGMGYGPLLLALTLAVSQQLATGLGLLGIEVLESM